MIGIFDSGIGGLTVMRGILSHLPQYDIVYFGDTARTPYGNKSSQTVIEYAIEDTQFLIEKGAKLIIIACNTASSVATEILREKFDIPIFEVITPAVNKSLSVTKKKYIGVIGTRGTIKSDIYRSTILEQQPDTKVFSEACPLLVPLVEEGWLKRPETTRIIKKYLRPLKAKQVDTLILGCTHYPLLRATIKSVMGKSTRIIDSSEAMASQIAAFLNEHPDLENELPKNNHHQLFVSDLTDQFKRIAESALKQNVHLTQINL